MPTNCFSFAPRDSVPGLIAKICKYLKEHPGWSEEDLKDKIDKLVHDAGVQSFNGRTGDVVLSSEDVNALKIATAYFGEDDETIDELDIKAMYDVGIRFVFTDFNTVTSSYNNSYVIDYFPGSDDIAYYPISTADGGGGSVTAAVTSVNGKTGNVTINLADVLGASGAQVKLCTATEFTANTIDTWNAYYDDGYRIVGVVNDGATAVDYLYLLKQDENNHQPIKLVSGNGSGAVDSVNGQTGVVTVGEAGVVDEESEATQYMQVFVDESQDYEPVTNANQLDGKSVAELMLEIYPVGSIYMTTKNEETDRPAYRFGGTWEQIKGRFLLGAGANEANTDTTYGSLAAGTVNRAAGEMGGEAAHKLTISEIPNHDHGNLAVNGDGSYQVAYGDGNVVGTLAGKISLTPGSGAYSLKVSAQGGDQPHNNMPPYLAVYMWQRIPDEEVA